MMTIKSASGSSVDKWTAPRSDPYAKISTNASASLSQAPIHVDENGNNAFAMKQQPSKTSIQELGQIHVKRDVSQQIFQV